MRYEIARVDGKWGVYDTRTCKFEQIVCACGYRGIGFNSAARHRQTPHCSDKEEKLRETADKLCEIRNLADETESYASE